MPFKSQHLQAKFIYQENKDKILNMETKMEALNTTHTEEMNDMKKSLLDSGWY